MEDNGFSEKSFLQPISFIVENDYFCVQCSKFLINEYKIHDETSFDDCKVGEFSWRIVQLKNRLFCHDCIIYVKNRSIDKQLTERERVSLSHPRVG